MNTMELRDLLQAARLLHARVDDSIRMLEAQHKADGVPALKPGAVVTFRHRGKELKGQLGQVRGEELYVYVDNDDGFGTTGYRTTKARLVYPDAVLSGEELKAGAFLLDLVERMAKKDEAGDIELKEG
jgi:hypothetical protein